MLSKIISFLKKEIVLTVSGILAFFSCFFVLPDSEYAGYIDFHTILILFCLMGVMAGLQDIGLFQRIGEALLRRFHSERGIAIVLVALCFFSSMLITNDVALITFVPLALLVISMAQLESSLCPIVVLMTISANLGSMLTPIGNPQNLYLYSTSGMSLGDFLTLMLPHTCLAAFLLLITIVVRFRSTAIPFDLPSNEAVLNRRRIIYYMLLFGLCILSVAKILPIGILFIIIVLAMLLDKPLLLQKIDYSLLLTFIFFFIFIGNMGRFPAFRDFISSIVAGHEIEVSILSSQVISNVPAALLLSGFTDKWTSLIVGVNLGGLGTLIASMASLISYKQVAQSFPHKKGNYLLQFTVYSLLFLFVLYVVG